MYICTYVYTYIYVYIYIWLNYVELRLHKPRQAGLNNDQAVRFTTFKFSGSFTSLISGNDFVRDPWGWVWPTGGNTGGKDYPLVI